MLIFANSGRKVRECGCWFCVKVVLPVTRARNDDAEPEFRVTATHTQQHNNKQNTDIAVSKQHRIKMRERRKRSEPPVASPGLSYLPDVPLSEFAEVAVSRFKRRIRVAMVDHVRVSC